MKKTAPGPPSGVTNQSRPPFLAWNAVAAANRSASGGRSGAVSGAFSAAAKALASASQTGTHCSLGFAKFRAGKSTIKKGAPSGGAGDSRGFESLGEPWSPRRINALLVY
jgi:hypothetical protein